VDTPKGEGSKVRNRSWSRNYFKNNKLVSSLRNANICPIAETVVQAGQSGS
jgi:hypothetical protein